MAVCACVRVQVVESHPEHAFPDLRIAQPPAALRKLVDTQYADLAAIPSNAFAHTPWAVLLIRAVDAWRAANGGATPTTYTQKKEIRALIESMRRTGVQADQNIDEALNAVNTALNPAAPSASVAGILAEARGKLSSLVAECHQNMLTDGEPSSAAQPAAAAATARKTQLAFWLMAAATERFVANEGNGLLPLMGVIPDMTAGTGTYINLQQLYTQQASADVAAVQAHVREISAADGLSADTVTPEELKRFCKNAHALGKFAFHPAAMEYALERPADTAASASSLSSRLSAKLQSDDMSVAAGLYLLLRAAQAFRAQRSCWPGDEASAIESDLPHLKQCLGEVAKEIGLPPAASGSHVPDEQLAEFCRWGGSEMHAMASVMGGIASQEAIKAATHQYQPLNNTLIFNGASGTTATFEL